MSKGKAERQPWEQLRGEPDAAYARFLQFLSLGPARTLDAAYQLGGPKPATKRNKSRPKSKAKKSRRWTSDARRASGTWTSDCTLYHWQARANAKDIYDLIEVNRSAVVSYFGTMRAALAKLYEAALNGRIRPRSWGAILEGLLVIGSLIPPETAQAVADLGHESRVGGDRAEDGPQPTEP